MGFYKKLVFLVLTGTGLSGIAAQEPDKSEKGADHPVQPGHSYHGEVFNEGPRQKAYLMDKTGSVDFPITTKKRAAQDFFNQGVGQLHGFWYFEAERSFRQVAQIDPDCAMAYWGMAMANFENEKRAKPFMKKAVELAKDVSAREKMYVEALESYYLGKTTDKKKRQKQLVEDLDNIVKEYPEDLEAKAFLAVRSWQFRTGLPLSTQNVDKLLDEILKANPRHPAHHYRIHLWDGPKAAAALKSAAECGPAAPTIAHMWHMPGHTYAKLHRHADAAWQQEASARADHAHMMRDLVLPDQIHNYAHNQEWLIRSLSHVGRAKDAIIVAKNLIELPRHPKYNTLQRKGRSGSYGRTRLFEVLERFELWDDVIALADTMYLEPTDTPDEQVKRLRLLGLAHAGKGDQDKLKEIIAQLEERQAKSKAKDSSALRELRIQQALLDGDVKSVEEQLKNIKGPSQVRLSRYHLLAGDKQKAEQLARQASDAAKNQVVPLANYVEILHAAGKDKECGEAFGKLREISGHIDALDSPVFARLAPAAKALGWPEDWRQAARVPKDIGERPPLDRIGPLRWQPAPAPVWSLTDAKGGSCALKDYQKRPVIVVFFLGHGCSHCMEQLKTFSARAKDFDKEGISLIAVSTEKQEDLQRALESAKPMPFPVLADGQLEAFKSYRAYDDFERQPLHGTFLIDGAGRIRWQDISYDPFTNLDFLLQESRRLLAFRGD
jgi:peroxiredoxin